MKVEDHLRTRARQPLGQDVGGPTAGLIACTLTRFGMGQRLAHRAIFLRVSLARNKSAGSGRKPTAHAPTPASWPSSWPRSASPPADRCRATSTAPADLGPDRRPRAWPDCGSTPATATRPSASPSRPAGALRPSAPSTSWPCPAAARTRPMGPASLAGWTKRGERPEFDIVTGALDRRPDRALRLPGPQLGRAPDPRPTPARPAKILPLPRPGPAVPPASQQRRPAGPGRRQCPPTTCCRPSSPSTGAAAAC